MKTLRRKLAGARDALRDNLAGKKDVRWLFIATFANGGSTALARLLSNASSVVTLKPNGEGQWLIPEMVPGGKWEIAGRIDCDHVRKVWVRKARLSCDRECLVVEKTPANLLRMRELRNAFSAMPNKLVCYSRDPYAVTASWLKRYGKTFHERRIAAGQVDGQLGDYEHLRELGTRYGKRAVEMAKLMPDADLCLTYEALTQSPDKTVEALRKLDPLLANLDPSAKVRVKDYAEQPLRNMNDEQIATLSPTQINAVSDGLSQYGDAVKSLGYEIRL